MNNDEEDLYSAKSFLSIILGKNQQEVVKEQDDESEGHSNLQNNHGITTVSTEFQELKQKNLERII